jgi:hypothetical protein
VVLSLQWATDELLGRRRLSVEALAQLDSSGNRNGRYDTGDYLAYYRAQNGVAALKSGWGGEVAGAGPRAPRRLGGPGR